LVNHVGWRRLTAEVAATAVWFPLLLLLDALRISADALATRLLYGSRGHAVPWSVLLRAQLLAYPATLLMPAGRTAGEALKIGLLHRWVGLECAAAAAVFNQSLALLGGVTISLPCVATAFLVWGATPLSWAIAAQACAAIGLAAFLLFAQRRREVSGAVGLLSKDFGAAADRVQQDIKDMGVLPMAPLLAAVANRVLLGAQIVVLTYVIGIGAFKEGLLVLGTYLVGAAAGDFVPGQIGATDGALALAAGSIGSTVGQVVALALSIHASQLVWAIIGATAPLVWRERARDN
jgi:hypothetical protein